MNLAIYSTYIHFISRNRQPSMLTHNEVFEVSIAFFQFLYTFGTPGQTVLKAISPERWFVRGLSISMYT